MIRIVQYVGFGGTTIGIASTFDNAMKMAKEWVATNGSSLCEKLVVQLWGVPKLEVDNTVTKYNRLGAAVFPVTGKRPDGITMTTGVITITNAEPDVPIEER